MEEDIDHADGWVSETSANEWADDHEYWEDEKVWFDDDKHDWWEHTGDDELISFKYVVDSSLKCSKHNFD